ncbi:MsnO8 family LLM class oxidoreductase, partial [Burkholderia cenocepacia]
MSYSLSLLDKSPIADGANAADALRFTTTLAQRAEQLGYARFWVAEHHGTPGFASSAPEIVVAHLLAHTSRIRIGSGGVMLQHYSPFKVAETFKLLAALAPGRVDLGIGKAPGGLPLTTRALQWFHDKARKPDFAGQLAALDAFLGWGVAEDHPLAGAVAMPVPPQLPERVLLGGSPDSGALAARNGWRFC